MTKSYDKIAYINPIRCDKGSNGPWIDAMSAKKYKGSIIILMKSWNVAESAINRNRNIQYIYIYIYRLVV